MHLFFSMGSSKGAAAGGLPPPGKDARGQRPPQLSVRGAAAAVGGLRALLVACFNCVPGWLAWFVDFPPPLLPIPTCTDIAINGAHIVAERGAIQRICRQPRGSRWGRGHPAPGARGRRPAARAAAAVTACAPACFSPAALAKPALICDLSSLAVVLLAPVEAVGRGAPRRRAEVPAASGLHLWRLRRHAADVCLGFLRPESRQPAMHGAAAVARARGRMQAGACQPRMPAAAVLEPLTGAAGGGGP